MMWGLSLCLLIAATAILIMNAPVITSFGIELYEKGMLPDAITRLGIVGLLGTRRREQISLGERRVQDRTDFLRAFVKDLRNRGIAEKTDDANEQHYEVDSRFYDLVLGPKRKYSSALYPEGTEVGRASELLGDAEEAMLRLYAERAQIKKGDKLRLLDLGCGWGSVSLWFAQEFPTISVVGLSNSNSQREFIMGEAKKRGLNNIDVMTGDITEFEMPESVEKFDRVISIEMFEHMKNYEALLHKVRYQFLKDETSLLFVHIFVHRSMPYHFIDQGPGDWMTRYYFEGGTMPSDDLLLYFQNDLAMKDHWRINGKHYSLTLEAWLQNMDANAALVRPVLADVYGSENVDLWFQRWRAFFLACSELFRYNGGNEWFVSHYLFQPRS